MNLPAVALLLTLPLLVPDADLSTPEAAVKAFAAAIERADSEAAVRYLDVPPVPSPVLAAMADELRVGKYRFFVKSTRAKISGESASITIESGLFMDVDGKSA